MCTYEPAGRVYSLDDGVPVPKKLATELISPTKLQADLFLRRTKTGYFRALLRRGERRDDRRALTRSFGSFPTGSRYDLLPYCFQAPISWKQGKLNCENFA